MLHHTCKKLLRLTESKGRLISRSFSQQEILIENISHNDFPERFITKVTLNRPKANAMGSTMISELQYCLDELEQQSLISSNSSHITSRCVVLTSFSDRVFSAGADLKERREMPQDEAEFFVSQLRNTMQRIASLPQPTIAAIEGAALGGGLELALACDLRIAAESATLGLPETSLAIIPGAGGTQRLSRLVGVSRAKELIWTGRRITGDEALSIGMVDRLVEPSKTLDEAMSMAWKIAANGPIAIQASKEAIDQGLAASTMEEALEIERQCYGHTLPSTDRLEGLTAFQEGRQPNYRGK